ncbi:proline-specific peptidase [Xylariaceae sp. FL0255]|nr:proline-specific peptidase [Xylariaceae sp. FL0255]
MDQTPTKEGKIPFTVPERLLAGRSDVPSPCYTYYKVFGDLACAGHELNLTLAALWPRYGLPVIFYDQIGCGGSTWLPQTAGDKAFWHELLFVAELDNLLDAFNVRNGPGFYLFGQSWGGMFAGAFAASHPRGLGRLSIRIRLVELPPHEQQVLKKYTDSGEFNHPEYKAALMVFCHRYLCRDDPFPPEVSRALGNLDEDRIVYGTMNGPSLLVRNGSHVHWTSIPRLPQIKAPTLIYIGEFDTTTDISQIPYFELIPRVQYVTFTGAGHLCHLEAASKEKVFKTIGDFLTQGNAPIPDQGVIS